MSKATELFADARAKASAALEVESDEERKTLVEQAEALMAKANQIKAAEDVIKAASEPVKTVELPVDDNNGTSPQPQAEPVEDPTVKAAYTMRFGDSDAAVKAILHDLHGSDYEHKRLNQWKGFSRYLRTGEGESRDFIWTPDEVKVALREGQDVKAMKATMVEAQDTLGGYAVPSDFRAEVISRMAGYTVVRPMARVIQTSRDRVELPKMTGGGSQYRDAVTVTWVDETPANAAASSTNLTMGLEMVPVHTVMANTDLSRNLVEDAAFNLVDWLAESFASAQAIDEDNKFLTGDGVGCPQGVLADSGVSGWLGTGQQVVSGSASTLTWDGLIALTYKLDAQYRQKAVFVMEKATAEVIAKLKDSDGQYLWRERYGDNVAVGGAGTVQRLLGYPVLEQEGMPTVAANAFPIIFGDFSGYVIADRVGMTVERYIDSATSVTNTVRYVARRRLGGSGVETWKFAAQKVSAS